MFRLRPGWLVALCAAILAITVWLPWLTTRADGGGRANAIGGTVGNLVLPARFGAGQLITHSGVDVDRRGCDGGTRSVGPGGIDCRAGHFAVVGGVDAVVLPHQCPPTGVGGLRVLHRRGRGCGCGRVLGVDTRGIDDVRASSVVTGFVEPVTLTGQRWVSLEPLAREHVSEIAVAAADGDVGSLWFTGAPSPETAAQWVDVRLGLQQPDTGLTFVVRRLDGTLVGSSSYMNVDPPNRRLEIGNTWYGASARRSGVNTETKLLMLSHAFDELGCVAVEFRTHFFNFASRTAIERLGAKLDGVLRSHQLLPNGSRRDTVVYSILDIEWPSVRTHLQFRLDRHG